MGNSIGHSIYVFDDFRLDLSKLMLYRGEREISLPPKVIKTLAVLIENHDEILPKEELIERVWEGSIVEESNLSQYLYLIRKTLGKKAEGGEFIETFRRRGYRFNGPVDLIAERSPTNGFSGAASELAVERQGNVLRLVDWSKREDLPAVPDETNPVKPLEVKSSLSHPLRFLWIAALIIAAIAVSAFVVRNFWPTGERVQEHKEMTVTRLTNGLFIYGTAISPDGNFFVYFQDIGETMHLFVQQTGQTTRNDILTLPPGHSFLGPTFSPDSQWIYFVSTKADDQSGTLFRMPTMGGSPTKLLENVDSNVSFSPDGQQIVFRRISGLENSALLIADTEGRGERQIVERSGLNTLGYAAWSPIGNVIAFVELERAGEWKWSLKEIDITTNLEKSISRETWGNIHRIEWLPNGSGLVMIGTRVGDALTTFRDQVYTVSYPDGESRRITNDGNRYDPVGLGVTRAGAIIAIPSVRLSQIWSMDGKGDASTAVQLTRGGSDGRTGLVALRDGRIVYTVRTGDEITIWISNGEGADARQVTTGFKVLEEIRADPEGKYLIFSAASESQQKARQHIYRVDIDGGNIKQLTFGNSHEIDSSISPDGRVIVTDSEDLTSAEQKIGLKRIPADGGEPETLAVDNCRTPVFSPDGSMLSCIRNDSDIVIINASDGRKFGSFRLPPVNGSNVGALWMPDGSGTVAITHENGISNLTVYPLDGRKPHRLTNFTSGYIYRFAFSHDSSRLFVARGYPTQDAVLITNY